MHTIVPLTSELLEYHRETYLETLATLSPVGNHTQHSLLQTFQSMQSQGTTVFVAVDETAGIVGTCSVLLEHKCNRGGSQVAHVEDLAVHTRAQGQGVGTALLSVVKKYAINHGCYKIILDCDPQLEERYEKNGFSRAGIMMRIDL